MPELKNPKHELFAQNVAKGMSQDAAYEAVYPGNKNEASVRGNASRLRSNEIVAARIMDLLAAASVEAKKEIKSRIKSKMEVQQWWSDIIDGAKQVSKEQLKAAELLGKSDAWFTENVSHSGKITLEDIVAENASKKD